MDSAVISPEVGNIVHPRYITADMVRFAKTDELCHFAYNLNAMLEFGYCDKCGLTPVGCVREGCRANAKIHA